MPRNGDEPCRRCVRLACASGKGGGDPADSLAALLGVARLGTSLDAAVSSLMSAPPALAPSSPALLGLHAKPHKSKLSSPLTGVGKRK